MPQPDLKPIPFTSVNIAPPCCLNYPWCISMDLTGAIRSLRAEVEKIDRIIAALETLAPAAGVAEATEGAAPAPPRKRGRKGMSPEERQEVAERMRRYWAGRRGQEKTA